MSGAVLLLPPYAFMMWTGTHLHVSTCNLRTSFACSCCINILRYFAEEDIWAKRDEVIGEWRRLLNGELYNPNSSPNVIWLITSTRTIIIRWAGHVARTGGDFSLLIYDTI
jgi:hypothetical protein